MPMAQYDIAFLGNYTKVHHLDFLHVLLGLAPKC
jgi:hypothetical protein